MYIEPFKLQLENTIAQQKQEVESTQEKLKSHDIAAKRAIQQLQTELQGKLAHVSPNLKTAHPRLTEHTLIELLISLTAQYCIVLKLNGTAFDSDSIVNIYLVIL